MKIKSFNRATGKTGEALAEKFLKANGYKIIDRNVRSPFGEIDLIARHKKTVVFIEVKTRSNQDFGFPEESITKKKKIKLSRLAEWYLSALDRETEARFDVLAIELGPEKKIRLIENAFDVSN